MWRICWWFLLADAGEAAEDIIQNFSKIKLSWWDCVIFHEQYNAIDNFCYKIHDGIANLIEGRTKVLKQKFVPKKEFMNSKK